MNFQKNNTKEIATYIIATIYLKYYSNKVIIDSWR